MLQLWEMIELLVCLQGQTNHSLSHKCYMTFNISTYLVMCKESDNGETCYLQHSLESHYHQPKPTIPHKISINHETYMIVGIGVTT